MPVLIIDLEYSKIYNNYKAGVSSSSYNNKHLAINTLEHNESYLFYYCNSYQIPFGDNFIDRVLFKEIKKAKNCFNILYYSSHIFANYNYLFKISKLILKVLSILCLPLLFLKIISVVNLYKFINKYNLHTAQNLKIYFKFLIKTIFFILSLPIYKYILKKYKIRKYYTSNFYNYENFILIHCANCLNIETINIQHGNQSSMHPGFSSWRYMPKFGYSMFPKKFYCWDEESMKPIMKWNCEVYKPILYKNPLLALYTKKKRRNNEIFNILICLHPRIGVFPKLIKELLLNINEDKINWIIRPHPRFNFKETKSYYSEFGNNLRVSNPSNESLYSIFADTDIHITGFSTTCLDALNFNINTYFIDPLALKYYPTIANKKNVFLDSKTLKSKLIKDANNIII